MTTVFISLCISLLLNPASSRVCGLFFFLGENDSFINAICPSGRFFHRFVTGFRFVFFLEEFLYVLFFPFESCAFPFLFYVPLAEFGISFGLYHGLVLYYYDRSDGFLIFFLFLCWRIHSQSIALFFGFGPGYVPVGPEQSIHSLVLVVRLRR